MGDTKVATDDCQSTENHQRQSDDQGRFMNMIFSFSMGALFAEESHENQTEHIEGSHAGSYGTNAPENEVSSGRGEGPRITSYNVCYTKLLRLKHVAAFLPFAVDGIILGFTR